MALIRSNLKSGSVVLVGSYTADATVDISAYGSVSVSDFIVECPTTTSSTAINTVQSIQSVKGVATYTPAVLSISGNTLSVTLPTLMAEASSATGVGHVSQTEVIPINLYVTR